MQRRRSRWRSWTALVAAYALALQTLLIALSYGAHANPLAFDAHVLCLSSDQAPDGAPAPADTAHQLDCCVLGGNLLGKLLVPPVAQALPAMQARPAAPPPAAVATIALARIRSPLTARGPPAA